MLEPSKEDFKQCVHDLGTVWSYYPENNYGTQARYGKIGNSLCPFCKFNRLEDGLKKLDEQNTYFREQANHWNTLAEKVTLENESLKAENAEMKKSFLECKCTKEKIDRLTASLAAAQEALKLVDDMAKFDCPHEAEQQCKCQSVGNALQIKSWDALEKALADKDGTLAFEKWQKMEAVVEAARACYEEDDFITENSPGSFERDKKLGEALEALDAKG